LPERLTTKVADGHGNSIHSQWSVNVPLGGERSRRCAEVPGALDAAWRAPAPSGHLLRCSSRRLDSTSRWRGSRGGEATEGAELGDEHERALAGRPERPRSLGGRVVDPSHREGARASDGGRPCLGDSWGLRARGWSVLAAAREVGVSRTTGAAGGNLKPPPEPGSREGPKTEIRRSEVCPLSGGWSLEEVVELGRVGSGEGVRR
jgi:hypothetical protein